MRNGKMILTASLFVATLAMMAGVTYAADAPKDDAPKARRVRAKRTVADGWMRRLERLKLTDTQRNQIKAILTEADAQGKKTDDKAVRDKVMDEALVKIKETILTEEQRKKLSAVAARRSALRAKASAEKGEKGKGEKGKGEGRRGRGGPFGDMSEEQRAEMKKTWEDTREKLASAKTREERMKIISEAREKFMSSMTDEQKAKLTEFRKKHDPMMKLGMNEQQRTESMAIMTKAGEEARGAESREDRHKIFEAAKKKVYDEVLTDDQKKKADEMKAEREERMKKWRKRREEGGGGRRGRRGGGDKEKKDKEKKAEEK